VKRKKDKLLWVNVEGGGKINWWEQGKKRNGGENLGEKKDHLGGGGGTKTLGVWGTGGAKKMKKKSKEYKFWEGTRTEKSTNPAGEIPYWETEQRKHTLVLKEKLSGGGGVLNKEGK